MDYTATSVLLTHVSAPTVTTPTFTAITSTSATLGGNVTSDGAAAITARGVVYSSTNTNPMLGGAGVLSETTGGTTGAFTVNVSSLTPGTTYYFAAYATNSIDTTYTHVSTFTTNPDTTPPTNTIATPMPGAQFFSQNTNRAGIGISGTASDDIGVQNVVLYITNSSGQYWNGSTFVAAKTPVTATGTTTWSYTFTGVTSPDGLYSVQSIATDNAGNQSSPATTTFHIDNTAPTSTITFPANNGIYTRAGWTGTIAGTASDGAGAGVQHLQRRHQQVLGPGNH